MKNAVILHGTSSSSRGNWIPWLKENLEAEGWRVWSPDLPDAEKPNIKRYNQFLFSSDWKFNSDSVIVGHSSGAVEILGLLEALPEETNISAAVLVGAFKDDLAWESLTELFEDPFDFEKIKMRAKKFVFIHSDDDPYCPLEGAKELSEKLGGALIVLPGQKHFSVGTAGEKYREFPFLLELLEKL